MTGIFASVYMLPFALVNEIAPEEARGTAMGFTNMMSMILGAPLLIPLIGTLLKGRALAQGTADFTVASYQLGLSLLPLSFLLALLVLTWIKEPVKR